ncbi:hypothetical protein GCM10009525_06300 [Streptosporangium amethystogenes subsp. fukuiense]
MFIPAGRLSHQELRPSEAGGAGAGERAGIGISEGDGDHLIVLSVFPCGFTTATGKAAGEKH